MAPAPAAAGAAAGRSSSKPAVPQSVKRGAQFANAAQRESGGGKFRPYQAIILAEFVAAELLVSVTPIATRKNQPGLSPYVPRDMTKLLAIGAVFFLLELTSVGGSGKIGAAAGGIILLVVGMNEAANIAADLDIFSPAKKKKKGGSSTNDSSRGQ